MTTMNSDLVSCPHCGKSDRISIVERTSRLFEQQDGKLQMSFYKGPPVKLYNTFHTYICMLCGHFWDTESEPSKTRVVYGFPSPAEEEERVMVEGYRELMETMGTLGTPRKK